jgi:hypothetical protein
MECETDVRAPCASSLARLSVLPFPQCLSVDESAVRTSSPRLASPLRRWWPGSSDPQRILFTRDGCTCVSALSCPLTACAVQSSHLTALSAAQRTAEGEADGTPLGRRDTRVSEAVAYFPLLSPSVPNPLHRTGVRSNGLDGTGRDGQRISEGRTEQPTRRGPTVRDTHPGAHTAAMARDTVVHTGTSPSPALLRGFLRRKDRPAGQANLRFLKKQQDWTLTTAAWPSARYSMLPL